MADVDVLEKDLRDLGRVRAPDGFGARVLMLAGLPSWMADPYTEVETPIGRLRVAWNGQGVSAAQRADAGVDFERWFSERVGRPATRVPSLPARLAGQIEDEVTGRRRGRLQFDLRQLSEFERAVLGKTLEIPRGEVRTYAWVAREIGRPRAVRAVGTALGRNPIPVLIPCHRVVRSDGGLGEYSGGHAGAKRAILSHEGVDIDWLDDLARRGTRLIGGWTTRVFCLPTCRSVRRMREPNRVYLRDEREARRAGYRPCAHCRPAATT